MFSQIVRRFSIYTGINTANLNPEYVETIIGRNKNLREVYVRFTRDTELETACRDKGLTYADVLMLVQGQKPSLSFSNLQSKCEEYGVTEKTIIKLLDSTFGRGSK